MTHCRKPNFAPVDQWITFNQINPVYRCVACGDCDENNATVDHIVPQARGGINDPTNWQWMCRSCNSRKGPRPDSFWGQPLHFDKPINLTRCRIAQREECYGKILTYADYFTRPFSQTSGKIHIFAGVVGCGKTLFTPIIGHGLNHIIRRDCGEAHPRVHRMLVLTKETSIRDQLAADLGEDMKRYDILGVNPRVGVIGDPNNGMLTQLRGLDNADIWVSCIQMFFPENGRYRSNIAEIFAEFQVIVFDEPHFAWMQVLNILSFAHTSLCFGLTSTPIIGSGELIKKFYLLSLYDYQTAYDNDQCLKQVVKPDAPEWNEMVEVIKIESADLVTGEGDGKTDSCLGSGYNYNIRPAVTVMERVIAIVHDRDKRSSDWLPLYGTPKAASRRPDDAVVDVVYPSHAMIVVHSRKDADMLEQVMTRSLDCDRQKYQKKQGYNVAVVYSDTTDLDGSQIKGHKLSPDHAWFWSYQNGGKLSEKSVRFLIVIDMGREGVNLPYCNVIGVADGNKSVVEVVQRLIGRQIRAVTDTRDGKLHIARAELDQIKIVTHETYRNEDAIKQGVKFVLDMETWLSEIPTIDNLIDGEEDISAVSGDPEKMLTPGEKLEIIDAVGRIRIDDGDPDENIDQIGKEWGGSSKEKEKEAREWATRVIHEPKGVEKSLRLYKELEEVPRVMWEYLTINPTDEELNKFVLTHIPQFADKVSQIEIYRDMLVYIYKEHYQRFRLQEITASTTTSKIVKEMAVNLRRKMLGRTFNGNEDVIFSLIGAAIKKTLGVKKGEKMTDKGKYDTAECHAILNRSEVRRNIAGWAIRNLIDTGQCPSLAAGLKLACEREQEVCVNE